MKYCMYFYLNWLRNYAWLDLKLLDLLNNKQTSKFGHAQFLSQLRQKFIQYTANIYSQITVGFATQPKSVLSTVKLQSLAVQITVIDFEEYSYSLSDVLGCNMCSKITVGYATQLKAVPSTVKIFAVQAQFFQNVSVQCA